MPTAEETDVLREDMASFCSDFRDFEERLKAKGVMIKSRVSMAPPSAEYATIINISDYTVTAAAPVRAMTVSEKRSKAPAKRAMRKEDD
jgi:trehalose-6-phosphate synthase